MGATLIPTPAAGDVVLSSWGAAVAAAENGIQSGTVNAVLSSATVSPAVLITFPRPYATPPVVVVAPIAGGGLFHACMESAPTTTGVLVRAAFRDATAQSATIPLHWVAIGVPA